MWMLLLVLLLGVLLLAVARNHALGMIRFKERPVGYSPQGGVLNVIKKSFGGFNAYRSRITHTPKDIGREYSVHYITSEKGVDLVGWHIANTGNAGLVLMLNWFGGCKSDNLLAAEIYLNLGYEVFLLDVRGHGDSSGNQTYFGYYEYRDVLAGVEYVKYKIEPEKLIVYGVSLGAVAVMRAFYASDITGVDGLILEAPFDRLVTTIRHRVQAFHLPAFFFADLLSIIGGIIQQYNPYTFNPVEYAKEINIPVLIISGTKDPFVMCSEVEKIFLNIKKNTISKLVFIPEHEHGAAVFHNKHIFEKEVRGFLVNL